MTSSARWRSAGLGPSGGLDFLQRAFGFLPLRVAYLLVLGLAPIYFLHHNQARHGVVRAMRRMGLGLPWWRALGAYVQYTFTLVDRCYVMLGRLEPRIEREGDEAVYARLDRLLAEGRPLILLGHHCGVLEIAAASLEERGRSVRAVAVQDSGARELLDTVGDPAKSVGGARRTIVADGSMRAGLRMLHALRAGDVLAFKADRVPPGVHATETVSVFGEKVDLPRGPHDIARLSKADVEVVSVFRVGAGRYRLVSDPLPEGTTSERVQAFGRLLASHVRRRPNQWFNFFPFWQADARELADMPTTVPPGMRAAAVGLAAGFAGALAAVVLLGVTGGGLGPVWRPLMGWGFAGLLAFWFAVGFLGGGLDRRGRPNALAVTALQASWAWPLAIVLAHADVGGVWWILQLAGALGLAVLAERFVTIRLLKAQDEDGVSGGATPRPPAAPASPDPDPSGAGTAPRGSPPASVPAP